ncbi:hypothetical protein V7S43_002484 [Phytophthora oleae]|uniref:SUN domain-containing protein n=1 Tax=Phytophthora oleae TaxID=2107226 RepID=A0ABD3G180_9STRA
MRSTVSVEDTEPLNTAAHRQPPSRPCAESLAAVMEAFGEQQTQTKAMLSNPLRLIRGGLLAFILLSVGIKVLSLPIMRSNPQTESQFERLERSIELLGKGTNKLETTAGRFLHSVQEAQVAASSRTEMLQNTVKKGFEEQVKMQTQENEQVMRDVLQYYVQQKKEMMETKERLMKMNITLPVEIAVKSMPETWKQMRQKLLGQEEDQESPPNEGLSFEEDDYQRLHSESVSMNEPESSKGWMRVEQSPSYGSFFFYIFVIGASAFYLWNAVSDMGKTKLVDEKWEWSPVPKSLTRLKALLGSVVVVEDLRTVNSKDDASDSPVYVEQIKF